MTSLKDLKTKKKSVESTQKITSAMKMVAGAKLNRLHQQLEASQSGFLLLQDIFARLLTHLPSMDPLPPFLTPLNSGEGKRHLLVVMTSNRGLCGAFNNNLLRAAKKFIHGKKQQGERLLILCLGKKGHEYFRKEEPELMLESFLDLGHPRLTFLESEKVAEVVLSSFQKGEIEACTAVYNKFKNALTQEILFEALLPLQVLPHPEGDLREGAIILEEFDIEALLKITFPFLIGARIHQAVLNSHVGEQGARMTAMDNATRNAIKMIKKLELTYNRMRQAYITKELIEIISGAEAI